MSTANSAGAEKEAETQPYLTSTDDPLGHVWATNFLEEFIEEAESAKGLNPRKTREPIATAKQMVPVVRQILLRLDPQLAEFRLGGWAGWDAAIDAAHEGIGVMRANREVEARMGPSLPVAGPGQWHPTVLGASRSLMEGDHFHQAVSQAAEQVVQSVRSRTGRQDLAGGTDVWRQAFSGEPPAPGKPRLRWPGDPADRDVKTMNEGLRHLAEGLQLTVRNPSAHPKTEMNRQEALERLAALSLLANLVEHCDLLAEGPEADVSQGPQALTEGSQ